jgi:hypothetical protein
MHLNDSGETKNQSGLSKPASPMAAQSKQKNSFFQPVEVDDEWSF